MANQYYKTIGEAAQELGLISNLYGDSSVREISRYHCQSGSMVLSTIEFRRGFENRGAEKRSRLRLDKYKDPFLHLRIALFEVFRQWRTDYLKAYSKEFELAESSLGPLVLELLKRYNLNAINAFREPLLRNQVLRSLGNSVDERLFQDYFLSDTKHQTENATHIIFWLVLLSDPVRDSARQILESWWNNESFITRECVVCGRDFSLRERHFEGADSRAVSLSDIFFDNLCLDCPVLYPRPTSKKELHTAVKEYVDSCGFIPMRPIAVTDPMLIPRIGKHNFIRFLMAWGNLGGPDVEWTNEWIDMLLDAGIFPGDVVRTKRGYRCIAEDGARCRSLDEKTIDDLLTSLGKKHEHEPHYPYDPEFNPNERKRADWKVGDLFIEYFGMIDSKEYAEKAYQKKLLVDKHKLRLLSLYPNDMIDMTSEKLSRLLSG